MFDMLGEFSRARSSAGKQIAFDAIELLGPISELEILPRLLSVSLGITSGVFLRDCYLKHMLQA